MLPETAISFTRDTETALKQTGTDNKPVRSLSRSSFSIAFSTLAARSALASLRVKIFSRGDVECI